MKVIVHSKRGLEQGLSRGGRIKIRVGQTLNKQDMEGLDYQYFVDLPEVFHPLHVGHMLYL